MAEQKPEWLTMLMVEAEVGQLETALNVARNYVMTAEDKEALRRLVLNQPDCTAHRLYQAISMLISAEPSSEEISSAIQKVAWILDGQIFRSGLWWSGVAAFKEYDSLTSLWRVN